MVGGVCAATASCIHGSYPVDAIWVSQAMRLDSTRSELIGEDDHRIAEVVFNLRVQKPQMQQFRISRQEN